MIVLVRVCWCCYNYRLSLIGKKRGQERETRRPTSRHIIVWWVVCRDDKYTFFALCGRVVLKPSMLQYVRDEQVPHKQGQVGVGAVSRAQTHATI